MSAFTRFLGDTPLKVFLKLLVISFLVGMVMNAFGWSPMDLLYRLADLFREIWDMGFAAIERVLSYVLVGAAVVVPAFILLRVLSYRR